MKEYIVLSTDNVTVTPDGSYVFRILRPLKNVKSLRVVFASLPKTGRFLTTDLNIRVQGGLGLNTAQKATSIEKNENNDPTFNFLGRLQFQDLTVGSFVEFVVKQALQWGTVPQFVFENNNSEYMKYIFKPTLPTLNQVRLRFDDIKASLDRQYSPVLHAITVGGENIDSADIESPDDTLFKLQKMSENNGSLTMIKNASFHSYFKSDTDSLLYSFSDCIAQLPIFKEVYMAHLYGYTSTNQGSSYTEDPLWYNSSFDDYATAPFANNGFPLPQPFNNASGLLPALDLVDDVSLLTQLDRYYSKKTIEYITSRAPVTLFESTDKEPYATDYLTSVYISPMTLSIGKVSDEIMTYMKKFSLFSGKIYKYGWNVHSDFPNNYRDPWLPRSPGKTSPYKYDTRVDYNGGGFFDGYEEFVQSAYGGHVAVDNFAAYAFDFSKYKQHNFIAHETVPVSESVAHDIQHKTPGRCIFVPGPDLQAILDTFQSHVARYCFLAVMLKCTRLRAASVRKKGSTTITDYDFYSVKNVYLPDDYKWSLRTNNRSEGDAYLLNSINHPHFESKFCLALELNRDIRPKKEYSFTGMSALDIQSTDVELTYADNFYYFKGSETGKETISIDTLSEISAPASITLEADIEEPSCFLGICT